MNQQHMIQSTSCCHTGTGKRDAREIHVWWVISSYLCQCRTFGQATTCNAAVEIQDSSNWTQVAVVLGAAACTLEALFAYSSGLCDTHEI